MKPINFKEENMTIGRGQPQYQELPAHCDHSPQRVMTSCWELTLEEIEQITVTRKIWIQQLTFGRIFQPLLPLIEKPEMP